MTQPILGRPVRVLIVDDSALVRQIIAQELSKDPEIEVVGTAGDPFIARDKIIARQPDVITLDIEMPRMDGLTFLKQLNMHRPTPAVILSSLAENGTRISLDALEAGAIAVFCKPSGAENELSETMPALCEAIKGAALVDLSTRLRPSSRRTALPVRPAPPQPIAPTSLRNSAENRIIAIGASTGGTEALRTILSSLTPDCPPVMVVLHMPEGFTGRFAERLNDLCEIEVREARHGDLLTPGLALIGRGNHHLMLSTSGTNFCASLSNGPLVCRHRPSVEVLFASVARTAGAQALGAILTGMGADGAAGLLTMRQAGAHTIAQDEASCVVFGMPREAIALGAACEVLPIQHIGAACIRWAQQPVKAGYS